MDGDTAVTTIASALAAGKGIVMAISAGKCGKCTEWPIMASPADDDSDIVVGRTEDDGTRVAFSSTGPTDDDRIKPDVTAQAQSVYAADEDGMYSPIDGASFSAPIIAAVAVQMLQVEPILTPFTVHLNLGDTADRADIPDILYGWGVVDADEAIKIAEACADPQQGCDYALSVAGTSELPAACEAMPPYPNPFRVEVGFDIRVPRAETSVTNFVWNDSGQRVGVAFDPLMQAGTYTASFSNEALPSGLTLYAVEAGTARITGRVLLVR